MNKLAVFDIDGVLCEFEPALVRILEKEFGSVARVNRHEYSFTERFKKHSEVAVRAVELIEDPNFYYGLQRDEQAFIFAAQLMNQGYGVMYLTSRPKSCETFTRRWLEKNTYNYKGSLGLFCGIKDKSDFLADVDVDFVVDDSREQVEWLHNSGIHAYCWSQEWNEGVFPRLYVDKDETLMLWSNEEKEAVPFWEVVEVE